MQSPRFQREEIILAFPAARDELGSVTEVRSTLLASSLQSLRSRGLFDRYERLLAPAHRPAVLDTLAGQWLSIETACAHYSACDALGLPVSEQLALGGDVSHRIHGTLLGTVIRLAKTAGMTPWTLLPRGNELFRRTLRGGGGTQVTKVGPKEALVEMVGVPLLTIPYYRTALRGVYRAAVELFCKQAYVRDCTGPAAGPAAARLRIMWT